MTETDDKLFAPGYIFNDALNIARFNRRCRFFLAALVLLLCWLWQSFECGAEAAEPIKIGAVLPFSGGVELYGGQAKMGLVLATKEINAAGGISGRPVEIIYEDDKTDPVCAQNACRKLIDQDGVIAVVGPITSRNLNAIVPVAEEKKTPLLYATNYEGGKCSRYFFCFSTVPNQELAQLLPYMSKTFGNSYFMLGLDHEWPHKMFEFADPLIVAAGGQVVGTEYTDGSQTNFDPLIEKIAATKANVLLFAEKGPGMRFITQADEKGLFKKVTVAFLGLSEADLPIFDGKAQNMYVVVPFVAASSAPSITAFVDKIKADNGPDTMVSNYVMTHYDALFALKAAIEKAGTVDKEAIIDAMEGVTIESPAGAVTVGKNHHATMNLFLAKTKGTELVTVKDLGPIAPQPNCK